MRWLLKCWWFWAACLFIVVAIVAGYLFIPVSGSRISQQACAKIQLGWTPRQVVELLGPVSWTPEEVAEFLGPEIPSISILVWDDDDINCIEITFGRQGVTEKRFILTELTPLEVMRRRGQRRLDGIWAQLGY